MNLFYLFFIAFIFFINYETSDAKTRQTDLQKLLQIVYQNNPILAASKYDWETEDFLIQTKYAPEDLQVGISTLNRGSSTRYANISQKLKFPLKYYFATKAQNSLAESKKAQLLLTKFKIRQKLISLFYHIYVSNKTIALTKANIATVKEFSRVAERKYAAGKSPQADQMKAHFELTNLELELIKQKQQEQAYQDELRAVLHDPDFAGLNFSGTELSVPKFFKKQALPETIQELTKNLMKRSPKIQQQEQLLSARKYQQKEANWDFAPDFEFKYQKRISGEPQNSNSYAVNLSLPFWFWKKSANIAAASAKANAQEAYLHHSLHMIIAKIRDLVGKVEAAKKTLQVYETTLIPQAQGAYNSSRGAYRASKSSFLALIDSERSLYRVKTGFYDSLQLYIHHLTRLETELGFVVSDLSKGDKL